MAATRLAEIDFLRGVALTAMLAFHFAFDLSYFFRYPIAYDSGFWHYIGKISAVLFILIAGVSAELSRRTTRHAAVVLGAAALVSLVTYAVTPHSFIRFGILHCLGFAILTAPAVKKTPPPVLLTLAALIIPAGLKLQSAPAPNNLLLPLGLSTPYLPDLDYYPLLPWYGLFLIGAAFGRTYYAAGRPLLPFRPRPAFLTALGRRTLLIYLIHQPLILTVLAVAHL